jgi:hypothetical protein
VVGRGDVAQHEAGTGGAERYGKSTSINVACRVGHGTETGSYTEVFTKLTGASRQRNSKVHSVTENFGSNGGGLPGNQFEPPALA